MKNMNLRAVIALSLIVCVTGISTAQGLQMDQKLPFDIEIKKGVLENGMTYYLHSTDVTKDVASYYIIQNVGSILENDDQQGLAHFLEHMAFNGTESFEGKGILNTFQKHGLVFGRDINAYTSFDETVYNIDNIPTTPELIDTGLQVLKDWSNYLLLTEEEIDAERGVIKEEWRTRQNGRMRILQQTIGTMFNNSKYTNRLPIGLMDIVENFDYKALRDFYHDWYRTDLQAIAIVGDFDAAEMEAKIKERFSSIPAVENPIERSIVTIPDNEKMGFQMATDPEVATSSIQFSIRHKKSLEDQTVGNLAEGLLDAMISNMLSARLREVAQEPDAPFLGARIGYGKMVLAHNALNVQISPKPDQQHAAFKSVMTELNRAVKHGFTLSEIERTITEFSNYYTNQIQSKDDRSHGQIISMIQANYLENETITDVAEEFEMAKQIFGFIRPEVVHSRLKYLYTPINRTMLVTGVAGRKNLTEEDALAIIDEVENDATIEAYAEDFEGKTLMSGVEIEKGRIAAIQFNDAIGSTTFTLSNGVKVHYKYSDKEKNSVKLQAISEGGMSLVADEDLPSANLMGNLVQMSGIGDYSAVEYQKVMAGITASANISLNELTESINGSSVTKDVESMLQLVHLRFVKPRFEEQAWQVLQGGIKNYLLRRAGDLNEKKNDSITITLYGNDNPKKRIFNEQFVNEVTFAKMKGVYKSRFNNASDFEFFIVGDVTEEDLKPLLAKYIASIPTNAVEENWVDNSVEWVDNTIDKDIYMEMEDPKSTVNVVIKNKMDYSLKNYWLAKALGDILQLRYTETLREEEGGTYGAGTYGNISKRPFGQAIVQVRFDCNPEKVEGLIAIVHKELAKIKDGNIQQTDLDKTLTNYLKEREEAKNYSSFEMSLLKNYFREGYDMNQPENFENIIKGIKASDVQQFTKNLFTNAASYEIVFKPIK